MKASGSKWRLNERKFMKTGVKTYHKRRIPGTIRLTRMPGGSGFRGYKQWRQVENTYS